MSHDVYTYLRPLACPGDGLDIPDPLRRDFPLNEAAA